jgi:hypothetical protein
LGLLDDAVAFAIPSIPFVIGLGVGDLVFGVVRAADVNDLASFHGDTALRGRNLGLAFADGELRLRVGVDLDAVDPFTQRKHGHVGGVNFHIRFRAFEYRIVDDPARHLDLNMLLGKGCDLDVGILVQAQNVGEVKLDFSA